LAADAARDLNAFVRCFAPDALVRDEARSHVGHEARAWKAHADATMPSRLTPLGLLRQGARWKLLAKACSPALHDSAVLAHREMAILASARKRSRRDSLAASKGHARIAVSAVKPRCTCAK
jgi:hypothetical protein